jgi:prepilin-type N-terminal cleavage/methylation domain-containing protein
MVFNINRQIRSIRGFTLVELLIVVAIIGLLATGVLMVMNPSTYFRNSRDARRKSDLQTIRTAVELFYAGNSSYPNSTNGAITSLNSAIKDGTSWTFPASGGTTYLQLAPKDPQSTNPAYCYVSSGTGYNLCAEVEGTGTSSTPCTPSGDTTPRNYDFCVSNTF